MKTFKDILSPFSYAILMLSSILSWIIVFLPSFKEFLAVIAAEMITQGLVVILERKIFLWRYPDATLYFPDIQDEAIANLPTEDRAALFNSLVRFPSRRAWHCFWMSYAKFILPAFIVVFYWDHDTSNLVQFLKVFSMMSVAYVFFYVAIYIENHGLVSRKINDFHRRDNWAEVFSKVTLPYNKAEFESREATALACIWIFMVGLQLVIIMTHQASTTIPLAAEVGFVGLAGLTLISRVWYLSRKFFSDGLDSIFKVLENFDPKSYQDVLPLHSAPLLAQFERTFNDLTLRLRAYEQELSHWTFVKAEEHRYKALGEMSALIVHDLSAPLQVIFFCTERLIEDPQLIHNPKYLRQLAVNGQRSVELIDSLKSSLKGNPNETYCPFAPVLAYVIRLCENKFSIKTSEPIIFETDAALANAAVMMSKADLVHLLLNLLSNSVQNFLDHNIKNPTVRINLEGQVGDQLKISIADTGTGLSSDRYEELTTFAFLPSRPLEGRPGLGLRLVKRMVERYGGSLIVREAAPKTLGTTFVLTIKGRIQHALEEKSKYG